LGFNAEGEQQHVRKIYRVQTAAVGFVTQSQQREVISDHRVKKRKGEKQ